MRDKEYYKLLSDFITVNYEVFYKSGFVFLWSFSKKA